MKKILILFSILSIVIVIIVISFGANNIELSREIMNYIDSNYDEEESIIISIDEITDFKWDRMLVFHVGSSQKGISEALGVEFNESVDLMIGAVFVYDNEIVYTEIMPYSYESPNKFVYYFRKPADPMYKIFSPDNAIFEIIRRKKNGQFYYKLSFTP